MRCAYLDENELTAQDQPEGKFSVGDRVYVPNVVEWVWKPEMTMVEKVSIENGNMIYYAKCLYKNPVDNSSTLERHWYAFEEEEIFATLAECDEYISNHYYGGLCRGCKYDEKGGAVYFCGDCEFCKPDESYTEITDKRHGTLRCTKTGVVVGNRYKIPAHKICKYYTPTKPQNMREYESWESYDDILRNCDFNPKCKHHSTSCHKTCTYERYMNEVITIPYVFEFNGRKVKYIRIYRWQWIEQAFIDADKQIIKCIGLDYHFELNAHGKPKKECYPLKEWFDEIVTINITNGKFEAASGG